MANRPSVFNNEFFDAGVPAAGYKLYTYASGTTTPKATYTDQAGAIPNTNPITLDADGMCELWLGTGEYTLALYTGLIGGGGALVKTWDDVYGAPDATLEPRLTAPSGSSLIGFEQAGTDAADRTVQDKLRESVSLADFGPILTDGSGDGSLNIAALNKALASSLIGATPYQKSGVIELPDGDIYFGGYTITLTTQVHFRGKGTGQQTTGAGRTQLRWAADTVGIVARKATAGVPGCDGSILDGVYLKGGGGVGATTSHGIDMAARIVVRDSYVDGFRGNGINIVADSASNKNANCWRLDNVTCTNNVGHGVYAQGLDANAGLATSVDCTNNGGWGIWDSSFLGNNWIGCHTSGNTGGAYKADNANARAVFLGCYSEVGQPASSIVAPSLVLGGLHGAGFTAASKTWEIPSSTMNAIQMANMVGEASDASARTYIGYTDTAGATMQIEQGGIGGGISWRLKSATGRMYWDWANQGGTNFLEFYNANAVTAVNGFPRDLSVAGPLRTSLPIGLPNGYFDAGMLFRGTAAAPPAAGAWLRGDYLRNVAPAVGQPKGWYCTASGTPGTWVSEGNL